MRDAAAHILHTVQKVWQTRSHEELVYIVILLGYLTLYLVAGFVLPIFLPAGYDLYGFSQLRHLGLWKALLLLCLLILLVIGYRKAKGPVESTFRSLQHRLYGKTIYLVIFAVVLTSVFFLLRNNFLNLDGQTFEASFQRDVPSRGAHVTHDEMWELYLHSRFWFYTNQYLGWDVAFSYQVLSSLAGGVFVVLLLLFSRRAFPENPLGLFLITVSGGYMQLFFGDVENYTLTAVLVLAYLFSSFLYITGRQNIVVPSTILATALTFHLLAGFFLPSLTYLFYLELKRRRLRSLILGLVIPVLVVCATLLFFHFNGLPIRNLYWHSHAFGHGGNIVQMLARPSLLYYGSLLNLLFLLVPASMLLLPLVLFKRIELCSFNIHLIIATLSMLAFMFSWRAILGVYNDWNLFAIVAIPISLLVGYNLLRVKDMKLKSEILIPMTSMFFLHSLSWIVSNHF